MTYPVDHFLEGVGSEFATMFVAITLLVHDYRQGSMSIDNYSVWMHLRL